MKVVSGNISGDICEMAPLIRTGENCCSHAGAQLQRPENTSFVTSSSIRLHCVPNRIDSEISHFSC